MGFLDDGFSTLVSLPSAGVTFKEKTVQPPGLDGGDAIETSTMRNTALRTMAPRSLYTLTDSPIVVAYDVDVYDVIKTNINLNQEIVITFPDSKTLTFFGFLRTFEPDALEEGTQPEATITITPTNVDLTGAEIAPVVG